MTSRLKKPTVFAAREARQLIGGLSKAAILDIAYNLALLGTDESPEQVATHLCREAQIVLKGRGDRVPPAVKQAARRRIDADPEGLE